MAWKRKDKPEDERFLERFTANMKARLELTTRRYLKLLLREKIKWLNRNERE